MVLSHRAQFQLIINFFRVKAISTGLMGKIYTPNNLTASPPNGDNELFGLHPPTPNGVNEMFGSFFRSLRDFGKKVFNFAVKTFFFGFRLICLTERDHGRGTFPLMLKTGQNWGKIANYPPNAQQRSAPLHEEADQRLFLHVKHVTKSSDSHFIKTVDTIGVARGGRGGGGFSPPIKIPPMMRNYDIIA